MARRTFLLRLFFVSSIISLLFRDSSSFAVKKKPPPIIACKNTWEVEEAISAYVKPQDCVLELGALLSGTSSHLCRTIGSNGKAVLVDVKRKEATSGRTKGRNMIPFVGYADCMASNTGQ